MDELEVMLRDPRFYCRKYETIEEELGGYDLHAWIYNLALNLKDDHINIFSYDGVVYIGLESRKLDYDRDYLEK